MDSMDHHDAIADRRALYTCTSGAARSRASSSEILTIVNMKKNSEAAQLDAGVIEGHAALCAIAPAMLLLLVQESGGNAANAVAGLHLAVREQRRNVGSACGSSMQKFLHSLIECGCAVGWSCRGQAARRSWSAATQSSMAEQTLRLDRPESSSSLLATRSPEDGPSPRCPT